VLRAVARWVDHGIQKGKWPLLYDRWRPGIDASMFEWGKS